MNSDRPLPNYFSTEIEKQIIGGCLSDPSTIAHLSGLGVDESWFVSTQIREIWKALSSMYSDGDEIDVVTVTIWLSDHGLLDRTPARVVAECSGDYIQTTVEYIFQKFSEQQRLRRLFNVSSALNKLLYDLPISSEDVIQNLRRQLDAIENMSNVDPVSLTEVYGAMASEIMTFDPRSKMSFGLRTVDKKTGPLYPSETTIIAGESGIGKTSFVMNILSYLNRVRKMPVLLFSLEMDEVITALRFLSSDAHVDLTELREGRIPMDALLRLIEMNQSDNFFIDCNTWSMDEIEAKTAYMVKKHGVRAVALDYIQLAEVPSISERRELEISMIGRACKRMAKNNEIHVYALSQLDDAWGGRGQSKKPTGKNLRESKALKHHTDNLVILRRTGRPDEVELYIDKMRNNATGSVTMRFIKNQTRFVDLDRQQLPPQVQGPPPVLPF